MSIIRSETCRKFRIEGRPTTFLEWAWDSSDFSAPQTAPPIPDLLGHPLMPNNREGESKRKDSISLFLHGIQHFFRSVAPKM
jgi:hypothetical protein